MFKAPSDHPRRFALLARALALVAVALVLAAPAARAAGETATAVDVKEVERLVETLEDADKRAALVGQLKVLVEAHRAGPDEAAPESAGARALAAISHRVDAVSRDLIRAASAVMEMPALLESLRKGLAEPEQRSAWLGLLGKVALVLVAGALAEMLARRLLGRAASALEHRERDGIWSRLPLLLGRTLIDLAGIVAFALVAYGLLSAVDPRENTRLVALTLINASVIARAVMALVRTIFSAHAPALRLHRMTDETASYWTVWFSRVTNVAVYGYFLVEAAALLGLPRALHALLLDLLGLAVTAMLVVVILQNRTAVADLVRGRPAADGGVLARLRGRAAGAWHVLANAYVVGVYAVWAMDVPGGFEFISQATALTVVVLVLGAAAQFGFRRGLERMFALNDDLKSRFPGLDARANRYVPVLRTVGTALILGFMSVAILQAWSIDVLGWLGGDTGQAILGKAVTIAFILLGAVVVWEVVSAAIEFWIHRMESAGATRSARLNTLLPLARKTLFVVLVVMVTLTVLSGIGIDIGPLLAGAGVIGLAVGFGAQTLVKDIITGVFILIEDSIGIGDFISVGSHTGTVESLSIRTIRLRDSEGSVHTVPFSDVTSVQNYTKDFSFALMDIGIAYRENVDDVIEVLKQLGEEIRADAIWGVHIIEPIQVLGLHAMGDSAIVVRARLKTVPGQQWAVRREFYRITKRRFDELGIEIPFPHQTIYFGVDKEGKAPPAPVRIEQAVPDPTTT